MPSKSHKLIEALDKFLKLELVEKQAKSIHKAILFHRNLYSLLFAFQYHSQLYYKLAFLSANIVITVLLYLEVVSSLYAVF